FPQHMTIDYVRSYSLSAGPPAAPGAASASATSASQIQLSWGASATAGAVYDIYSSTTSGFAIDENATLLASRISGTSYTHKGLTPGSTHYYRVAAATQGGESAATAQVGATTPATGTGNGNGIAINAGGYAVGSYATDVYYAGGNPASGSATINT